MTGADMTRSAGRWGCRNHGVSKCTTGRQAGASTLKNYAVALRGSERTSTAPALLVPALLLTTQMVCPSDRRMAWLLLYTTHTNERACCWHDGRHEPVAALRMGTAESHAGLRGGWDLDLQRFVKH